MMKACIDVFNSHVRNRSYARNWMENAVLLAVSPHVKEQLSKKLEEMESLGIPEPGAKVRTNTSSSSPWKIALIVIVAIARIATCRDSSSSNTRYQITPYTPYTLDKARLFDSLINSRNDTAQFPVKKATDTPTFTYKIKRHPKHK